MKQKYTVERNDQLRERIQTALVEFDVRGVSHAGRRSAAVALAIADVGHGADVDGMDAIGSWSSDAAMILTRRSSKLTSHAGQWALPGGRIDNVETPEQAALRELSEEVGLKLAADCVLGRLDDFATRSGFVITPVVIWAGAARELVANTAEVASMHRVPLTEFLRADAPMLETIPESAEPVLRMPLGAGWIAAPTAALLYQFRELCLLGKPTRVAHFEQPVFAWK